MNITVAIATFNRSRDLQLTLESLAGVDTTAAGAYEVLVVDNNSSDDTAGVVARYGPRFGGRLRYIHEPRQGLSQARNRAVAEARHEVIAFLDDDVDVHVNWMKALVAAYRANGWAAVGGKAYLLYPRSRPSWLSDRGEVFLTKVDLGPEPRRAKPDELFGVNFSIRKDWGEKVGWFRTDLGRVGKCLLGNEETDLLERIAAAGGELFYEPAAVVGHRVAPARLNRQWFLSRCFWGNVSEIRSWPTHFVSLRTLARLALLCGKAGCDLLYGLFEPGSNSKVLFDKTTRFACLLGRSAGCFQLLYQRSLNRA
jgi:glycosyltransferase involved in cell wall biosynthesis